MAHLVESCLGVNMNKEIKLGYFELKRKMIELVYKLRTQLNNKEEYLKTKKELNSLKKQNRLAWLEVQWIKK